MAVASALGGGDKKHETHEQPSSGVGERRHTDEGEVEAERARSWLEYCGVYLILCGWGHYEARARVLGVAVWLGGVGGGVGEGNARAGSEDLGHRFAAAWVRVQAAFGDG